MYYVLLLDFDDCYHNNMLKTVNYEDWCYIIVWKI
jgi:hypothetical protein